MFRYIFVLLGLATAGTVAWLALGAFQSPAGDPAPSSVSVTERQSTDREDKAAISPAGPLEEVRTGVLGSPAVAEAPPAPAARAASPLAALRHAARAPDFEELLIAYDSVSAAILEEFNARYAGAIAFRTDGEFEWMAEHGFPLPEEILAAADMPLQDLRTLADGGDPKAQFLYLDRTLQDVRELRQSYLRSGISPDGLTDIPEYGDALIRAAYAKSYLTDSDSPFAGYLMAEFSRAAFDNPYGYMAGLLHASHLGDPRAYGKLRAFARQNDISEDALHAMGAYAVIVEGRGMRRKPE